MVFASLFLSFFLSVPPSYPPSCLPSYHPSLLPMLLPSCLPSYSDFYRLYSPYLLRKQPPSSFDLHNPHPHHHLIPFSTAVEGATLTGPSRASPTPIPHSFCSSPLKCPSTNNCIYPAGPGGLRLKPFVLACTTDFYGGDLSNAPAADITACVNQCAVVGQCVAVSYKISTKTCYLKKELKKGIYSSDVTGEWSSLLARLETCEGARLTCCRCVRSIELWGGARCRSASCRESGQWGNRGIGWGNIRRGFVDRWKHGRNEIGNAGFTGTALIIRY